MSTPFIKMARNIWEMIHPSRSASSIASRSSSHSPICSTLTAKNLSHHYFSSQDGEEYDGIHRDGQHHQHEGKQNARRIRPGRLAVYVGSERHRFVIPIKYLNLPVFAALLKQAEEEYGDQNSGALVLPCDVGFFDALLHKKDNAFASLSLEHALRLFADTKAGACSCKKATTGILLRTGNVSATSSFTKRGFN